MMQLTDKQAYTVAEVAALTGFSRQTVTRLFEHEPGMLVIERGRPETMHKPGYRYRNILIPRAVYERVRQRLTVR
jgi:AraC-like DNA-binding protein